MNDVLRVAYHEALHAFVAFVRGATVNGISVVGHRNRDDTVTWDGRAQIDTLGLHPMAVAEIALAGPVAELHYVLVTKKSKDHSMPVADAFVGTTLLADFIPQLAEVLEAIRTGREPERMRVCAKAMRRGVVTESTVFLGDCFGDARDAIDAIGSDPGRLQTGIAAVVDILAQQDHAGRVMAAARELQDVDDSLDRTLPGDRVREIFGGQ
jgi:hypothetical protein